MSGQTPWSQRESPFHIHLPAACYSKTSSGVAPEQQIHGHHSASQGRRPIHDEAASHADMESPHEEQEKLLSDFDIDHDNAAAYQNATTPRSHAVSRSPFSVGASLIIRGFHFLSSTIAFIVPHILPLLGFLAFDKAHCHYPLAWCSMPFILSHIEL